MAAFIQLLVNVHTTSITHISLLALFIFCFTVEVFSALSSKHLPELHKHMESLQVLKMISVSWFLTLFIGVLNHTAAIFVIDCFFVDGVKVSKTQYELTHHCNTCICFIIVSVAICLQYFVKCQTHTR